MKIEDYESLFAYIQNPVCALEPIVGDEELPSLRLSHCNAAFARFIGMDWDSDGQTDFWTVASFERIVGKECGAILELTGGLTQGKSLTMDVPILPRDRWFECTFIRASSGNLLLIFTDSPANGFAREKIEFRGKDRYAFAAHDASDPNIAAKPGRVRSFRDKKGQPIPEESLAPCLARYRGEVPRLREMLSRVFPRGELRSYSRGDHFLKLTDRGIQYGFILRGVFRMYTVSGEGKDCTIGFYRQGNIFDTYGNVPPNTHTPIAFESQGESLVFTIDLDEIRPFMLGDYRWYKVFYLNQVSLIVSRYKKVYSLISEDAPARYRALIEEEKDLLPLVRSYHIASYLGITPETLSRIRRKFCLEG